MDSKEHKLSDVPKFSSSDTDGSRRYLRPSLRTEALTRVIARMLIPSSSPVFEGSQVRVVR